MPLKRSLIIITVFLITQTFLWSCRNEVEKIKPQKSDITESVYAYGFLKSKNQYQAYAKVNGIVQEIFVKEGDLVEEGQPLIYIADKATKLSTENARLAADYADYNANQAKLNELRINIDLAKSKMKNDSLLLNRQIVLWKQQIGTQNELEQRELTFQNSKTAYEAAILRYNDLEKQLNFSSKQSKNNLEISQEIESDFTIKSKIKGKVYSILKEKGEMVSAQTPLAVVGDAVDFILELQVDEYDIIKIKTGQKVLITLDSYKGEVFEASITRIYEIMNDRSKTFTIEAEFIRKPDVIFPNLTLEANIIIRENKNVLTIPRKYLINEEYVLKSNKEKIKVKTGIKDYQKAEIISGIDENDELILPAE
jgi:multidrug efflux pump subunit AcrA (membrane-fusion protein)